LEGSSEQTVRIHIQTCESIAEVTAAQQMHPMSRYLALKARFASAYAVGMQNFAEPRKCHIRNEVMECMCASRELLQHRLPVAPLRIAPHQEIRWYVVVVHLIGGRQSLARTEATCVFFELSLGLIS